MLATGRRHLVIDPFQDNYDRRGLGNVERAGLAGQLELIEERSCIALPRLAEAGRRFDFVFIDGSHRFDDIFVDFFYSDLLLDPHGYVVFDDLWMRTTRLVLSYIRTNRPDYTVTQVGPRSVGVVRKTGVDTRNGMFHREFYTGRSLLSHYGNTWLTGSGDSRLKDAARRLKSLVFR
jgi:hypothetical protein